MDQSTQIKNTCGHLYTALVEKGFLRNSITTPGNYEGRISIVYFCEISYNLDFSLKYHSQLFYIKATTFMKILFPNLAFVGLHFMY